MTKQQFEENSSHKFFNAVCKSFIINNYSDEACFNGRFKQTNLTVVAMICTLLKLYKVYQI